VEKRRERLGLGGTGLAEAPQLLLQAAAGRLLVAGDQRRVDRLQARRAAEGAHQPIVDARRVEGVQAGQEAQPVAGAELQHADDAPVRTQRNSTHFGYKCQELKWLFIQKYTESIKLSLYNVWINKVKTQLSHEYFNFI